MSLADHDWRLYYPPGTDRAGVTYDGVDLTFGRLTQNSEGRRIFTLAEPDVQLGEMTTADAQLPEEDARRFGVDFTSPTLVSFELGVDTVDTTAVQAGAFPAASPTISDAFSRTATNGWGLVDIGGVSWGVNLGTAANFTVGAGFANIVMTPVNTPHMTTVPVTDPDVDITLDFQFSALPTGSAGYSLSVLARSNGLGTNHYALRLDINTGGTLAGSILRRVAGSETTLANVIPMTLPVSANSTYKVRFQVQGDTLRARVWQTGTTEPSTWLMQATDTTFTAAGQVGVRAFAFTGNTNTNPVMRFDNYQVRTTGVATNAKGLSNLDAVGALRSAWRADAVRTRPGAVAELHRGHSGRTRVMYGRPRRFAIAGAAHTRKGYTSVVCDFQAADDLMYDPDEQSMRIDLTSTAPQGLLEPLLEPVSVFGTATKPNTITIGGNAPTWLLVEFFGPSSQPYLSVGDRFIIGLRTTFAPGVSGLLDPRPWVRTSLRSDGASLGSVFTRDSVSLPYMRLDPGQYTLNYTALDPVGSSYVIVRWRNAWTWW